MKFTLKDYQDEAVRDVLANLIDARDDWHGGRNRKTAFSLTAATGAGKTVMAAAVFEALFHGDDGFDFDRDPGAVVIWFSDDPSLNEQTRFRLMEASDRLRPTDLKVVEHPFSLPKFEAGKIYFLNTQKLGKNSLLVRGFEGDDDLLVRPDAQAFTIWDTIRNTIEDPALTLYLVLDEAHRGMGAQNRERSTIVQRLINGGNGVPGIPVVWGISATVERFNQAIAGMQGRSTLPPVTVDAARVQESGLLKDTIALDIPDEAGRFDTVLLGRATDKLREASTEWAYYAEGQGDGVRVQPLMVLQLPNTPSPKLVGQWLDTIFQHWPDLPETSVAHVLGEHKTQAFGAYNVPYIAPERVQDDSSIRVLLAKDAISTGWDCPRAEVMVSFRPASDPTHIAQLLGRMVRTPLARRIPGNDRLNSVDCLLPYFDRVAVERVVASLRDGSGEAPPMGRILVNPMEMKPNPDVPEPVWDAFALLPSQTRPQRGAKPAIRLTALAQELASDGLLPGAGGKAHAAMHKTLDDFIKAREAEFVEKRQSVLTVEGRTMLAELHGNHIQESRFETDADDAVVGDAYRRSARILSPDIARTYTLARAKRHGAEDLDEALIEAREEVAALHLMENLQIVFDPAASNLADAWLREYKDRIKQLPHERQEAYRQVIALSTEAQDVGLALPTSRFEPTVVRERNGNETKIRLYPRHLLCDAKGLYPAELNPLEQQVLDRESGREGFRFWYRNPDRASQDSLGIAYREGEGSKILRPDFVFFAEQDGHTVADIIDPHGIHLADALPKLRGLAIYAAEHPQAYRRIEAVAEVGGKLRRLDMTRQDVCEAVAIATSADHLYASEIGGDYA